MNTRKKMGVATLTLLMAGCATVPKGPSVAVMPGVGKSFEQFVTDDRTCRLYADQSIGTNVTDAGAANVVGGAAVGTVVGAAAGALMGGHQEAGTGAGVGLLAGAAMGSGNAGAVQYGMQRRYDIAYEQCMYAKGNQLPTAATSGQTYYVYPRHPARVYQQPPTMVIVPQNDAAPPSYNAPPPPPGYYLPPPPQ